MGYGFYTTKKEKELRDKIKDIQTRKSKTRVYYRKKISEIEKEEQSLREELYISLKKRNVKFDKEKRLKKMENRIFGDVVTE